MTRIEASVQLNSPHNGVGLVLMSAVMFGRESPEQH